LKIKKIDHESTKIRRHESLNVVLFRAFNLSCFRDCVSEFSAGKNAKIITKILIGIKKSGKAGVSFVEKRGGFQRSGTCISILFIGDGIRRDRKK